MFVKIRIFNFIYINISGIYIVYSCDNFLRYKRNYYKRETELKKKLEYVEKDNKRYQFQTFISCCIPAAINFHINIYLHQSYLILFIISSLQERIIQER